MPSEVSGFPHDSTLDRSRPLDIILMHFGGPETHEDVEPFLYNLFMDPFIIRAPLGRFRHFLAKRIARKRSHEAAQQYASIGFSPINRYTTEQAKALEDVVRQHRANTRVLVVNRYTAPHAADVVRQVRWEKADVCALTLYPHLSHSTSVSSIRDFDQAAESYIGRRPVMTRVYAWWFFESYLWHTWCLLRDELKAALDQGESVAIVFSAHGLPRKYVDRGDPYVGDIQAHFSRLQSLGQRWLESEGGDHAQAKVTWHLSWQSRVGPVEWMRPYTEDVVEQAARQGNGTLLMVPISFVSDHIETLFEMDVTYKKLALSMGFKNYRRCPVSNAHPAFISSLVDVLRVHGAV